MHKITECNNLLENYPSIENYFYCWKIIESKYDFQTAETYYKKWIEKFPKVWDNNNNYLQSFPWKYVINPERILHEKYSNIQEILNKLQIK